ncbi:transcription factor [Ganoderma sinense ZZ0214-1]|uniref:Transcription factor n=1 Tax=Ganoderma sinense ZZ0214-1 TaxID=1077348 RepID=A0A2G8SGA1_9APHY|nr:transcription factor [Ganoderma sinense ZZ0214-1]
MWAVSSLSVAPRTGPFYGGQWETLRGYGGRFGQVKIALLPAKRNRDPSYVPKALNAFLVFRLDFYENLKAKRAVAREQPDGTTGKRQQKHVSVEAGEVWHAMSDEEQAPYFKKAAQLKEEHGLKYGKDSSAEKKATPVPRKGKTAPKKGTTAPKKGDAALSTVATKKARGGKGRKARAADDPAVVLAVPYAGSSLHPSNDLPALSTVARTSHAVPTPVSTQPFDHEHSWSSPFVTSENLMPTPALTLCHTLSPSPGPSVYSFPPSASASRVPSPAVLDFASDGAFYQDVSQVPMAQFSIHGDYLAVPGYELYDHQSTFDGCAPLVPHHIGPVPYPALLAELNGAVPYQFSQQAIPVAPSPTWLDPELAAAGAEYAWSGELVDQALSIPAMNATVNQGAWPRVEPQLESPAMAAPHSLDWWMVQLDPLHSSNNAVAS